MMGKQLLLGELNLSGKEAVNCACMSVTVGRSLFRLTKCIPVEQQKVKRVRACVFHPFLILCKPAKIFFTCRLSCLVTVEALDHSGGGALASSSAVVLLNLHRGSPFPSDPFLGGVQQESL